MEIKKDDKNIIINFNKKEPTKRELFQQNVKNFKFDLSIGFSIFGILITILLGVTIFRILSGNDILTLKELLLTMSDIPSVGSNWLLTVDLTIHDSWGMFDFLRIFLNVFTNVFEFILWLVGAMWEVFKTLSFILAYIVGIV